MLEEESKATNDFEVWKREKEAVEYYLVQNVAGYAELDVLIRDPHIEDILCLHWNRPVAVVHREHPHHTLLEALNTHGDPVEVLHQRVRRMMDAFVVHAHHVYRGHPDLDPGSLSFRYVFSRLFGLAVAMPRVIQREQNLFLFDKLIPHDFCF